jgi:transcription antitermination factor NusG
MGLGTTFLPEYMVRYQSGNLRPKLLFHSYIFVALNEPILWPRLAAVIGVNRVLTYQPKDDDAYKEPMPVASDSIDMLRAAALDRDESDENRDLIEPGCRVRIVKGPMQGFSVQKPLVEWTDAERAGLVIYMFNRRSVVEFYLNDLQLESRHAQDCPG